MKISYGNQTIDLFDKYVPDKIILSLSGGLDSASLLYLICKHFPNVEIIPFTGKDLTAPFDALCSLDIVEFMKDTFPNHKIGQHYIYEFDIYDQELQEYAKERWNDERVLIDGQYVDRCNNIEGLVKVLEKQKHLEICEKMHECLIVTGITKNPPQDIMKNIGFDHLAEKRRSYTQENWAGKGDEYRPYINVDKKFVAGVYKEEGLMKTLYPITGSCVGTARETDYFAKECGHCFWCYEKKWAFDSQ